MECTFKTYSLLLNPHTLSHDPLTTFFNQLQDEALVLLS